MENTTPISFATSVLACTLAWALRHRHCFMESEVVHAHHITCMICNALLNVARPVVVTAVPLSKPLLSCREAWRVQCTEAAR